MHQSPLSVKGKFGPASRDLDDAEGHDLRRRVLMDGILTKPNFSPLGLETPEIVIRVVDFPAPLEPMIETTSP